MVSSSPSSVCWLHGMAMSCLSYFHAHTGHMQRSAQQAGHNGNFRFWQYTWRIVDILQNKHSSMRSEVPTLVIVRITIFEHMASCHLLEADKCFEETSCLSFRVEYAGSSFLQYVGIYVAEHMASHHRGRYFIKINSLRKPLHFH